MDDVGNVTHYIIWLGLRIAVGFYRCIPSAPQALFCPPVFFSSWLSFKPAETGAVLGT
jgi:hypothetical protein